jgi:very-short-patch-repair endonuclease
VDVSHKRISSVGRRQHGLVTRPQLRSMGHSDHQIDGAVASGFLVPMRRGVLLIGGAPLSSHTRLAAALLATGGVASHRSAAELLSLVDAAPPKPEITIGSTQSQRADDVRLSRSRDLRLDDIVEVAGLRATNATRTVIDLGSVASDRVVESAVERALHRNLTTIAMIEARLGEIARRGRPGVAALRRVLAQRADVAVASELELLIWQILRRHHVPLPQRQVPVTVSGQRFFLDMAYPTERLFIEGDGFGVHGGREAFESDRWRQNLLVLAGWLPLRFTWRQARRREVEVASQVLDALTMRGNSRSA